MVTFCSHCGADLSNQPVGAVFGRWEARCPDCGLVADDEMPLLAPGGDEVEYALDQWVPADRILIRNVLADRGVPWRWEAGPVLVVDERDQLIIELILDDLDAEEEGVDGTGDEDEDGDGDEEPAAEDVVVLPEAPQETMGDLFDVADRLMRDPLNAELVADLDELVAVVEESSAPFGVDKAVWRSIAERGGAVIDAADAVDEDAIGETARALREFLRQYV
jgi:hypothetical protein